MERRRSRAELQHEQELKELELRHIRFIHRVEAITRVVLTLIRGLTVTSFPFFTFLAIRSLAGETTFASIVVNLLSDIKIPEALAYVLGVAGAAGWITERKFRHRKTRKLTDRITELEKIADPNRTSSGLDPTGNTNPEDIV